MRAEGLAIGNANSAVSAVIADIGSDTREVRSNEGFRPIRLRPATGGILATVGDDGGIGAVGIEFTRYSLAGPGDEPWGCYRESGMRERTRADCLTVH